MFELKKSKKLFARSSLIMTTAGLALFICLLCGIATQNFKADAALSQKNCSGCDENPRVPFIGQTLRGEINSVQTHNHLFSLGKEQYLHLEFIANGLSADLILKGQNGKTIAESRAVESIPTPFVFVVKESGTYTLTIHARGNETGYYELVVEDFRSVQQQDSVRKRAEETLLQGKLLIQKWTFDSFQEAIKLFKESLLLWQGIKDKRGQTKATLALGNAYLLTSEPAKAIHNFNRAFLTSREIKSVRNESAAQIGLCKAYNVISEYKKGLKNCEQGVQLAEASGDQNLEAQSLDSLGQMYWYLDNLTAAITYHEKALALWEKIKNRHGKAETLLNFSYLEFQQGETDKALSSANTALQLYRTLENPRGEALVLVALGHYASRLGDKQKALSYYEQSLKIIRTTSDIRAEAEALTGVAWAYNALGEFDKAFSFNNEALRLFQKLGHRSSVVYLLMKLGEYFGKKKDYSNSLVYLHRALKLSKENNYSFFEALILRTLGDTYKSIGNKEHSLEYYKLALSQLKGTDFYAESKTLSDLGAIYQELGRSYFDKAEDYLQKALDSHRKIKDISNESLTLYRFARLERERGNLDKAKEYIETSLSLSDTLRSQFTNQDFRSLYFASAHDLHELYIDVLMRLDKERPDAGFANAAFEASERGRARTLLEMLAESKIVVRADADASLLAREQEIQKRLREKTEKQIKLLSGKHTAEEASVLAKEIESALAEYKELQNRIRLSSPRYASLTYPRPLSLKEIQEQLLDDETQLLEFSLGEEKSFLWVVSKNDTKSFELPKREVIEASVKGMLNSLIASEETRAFGNSKKNTTVLNSQSKYATDSLRLSQMLFGQAQSSLNAKRLLIVSDGALHNLPFGALPIESLKSKVQSPKSEEGVEFLISKYEIINLPSASTLALLREGKREVQKQINSVAVFADPVFNSDDERLLSNSVASNKTNSRKKIPSKPSTLRALFEIARASYNKTSLQRGGGFEIPRLPYSRGEADAVVSILSPENVFLALDFKANLNAATSPELANYNVVHFATHGFLNSEQPELSGVVFSRFNEHGESRDGFLSLQEIYNLRLPVELVVLSACETGLGKELKGEGVLGLTRGFMHAGTKRVIASLWKVDDVATAELMKRFYQKLLKEHLSPSEALRVAQMGMSQEKRWKSPYYWAAFQIQGEWN